MAMHPPKPILKPTQLEVLAEVRRLYQMGATTEQLAIVLDVEVWVLEQYLISLPKTYKKH